MFSKQNFNIQSILSFLIKVFLFFLPWQTIWVYRWGVLNGTKWEYGTLGFYGTEILLWVIVILFMIWYWKKFRLQTSDFRPQFSKDRIFVLACLSLISYLFISIAWSADRSLALQQSLRALEAFLLFFILFLGPLDSKSAIKWFVIGSIIPAILGIWQFLTQSTFAFKWLGIVSHSVWEAGTSVIQSDSIGRWLRAYSSFNHPNVFGGYLTISIIFILFLAYKKFQILPITVYCLLITVLFFTFSRSAWMALGMGLLICVFYHHITTSPHHHITYHLSLIIATLILILFFSLIYFPLLQTRFSNQSIPEIRSTEERVSGYGEAWQIFKQHPLLGVGAGNYTVAAYELNPNRPGWEYQPAHNTIVLFAAEQGIIGLLLCVFLILSLISYLSSFKNETGDRRCVIFLVLTWLLLAFFDHYLYSSYIGLMLSAVFLAVFARFNTHYLHS